MIIEDAEGLYAMYDRTETHQQQRQHTAKEPMVIDVQVRQPQHDCPIYRWDVQHACLRLTGMYHAEPGLPADLAILRLSEQLELPVLLLTPSSIAPYTIVEACLLGAISPNNHGSTAQEEAFPASGWFFVACVQADAQSDPPSSLSVLPPAQREALKTYVQTQTQTQQGDPQTTRSLAVCDAETAAHLLRETRLLLKRQQRAQPTKTTWLVREEVEKPVAWRAVEGLSEIMRWQVQHDAVFAQSEHAPHTQANALIRFVPQRFQHALARLLLDDEYLLAFVERPLLRHRTGWLGTKTWRANEGLFVVTDRHILWLRDFLSPGTTFLDGGYIAHMAPLERLQDVVILPPGKAPDELTGRLDEEVSPYQRLVISVTSATGAEHFVVEFPVNAEFEKALRHITGIQRAFLPRRDGAQDRRLRRVPHVERWTPQGVEAEKLIGLGGIVPAPIAQRLERQLAELQQTLHEEILVSVLIPALEDYKSPARLIALSQNGLLVIEEPGRGSRQIAGATEHPLLVHRYELPTISSVQLRYSLMGSGLSIFVPQPDGQTQNLMFPFHSPAIAWFLPLFTRLHLLLSAPYQQASDPVQSLYGESDV